MIEVALSEKELLSSSSLTILIDVVDGETEDLISFVLLPSLTLTSSYSGGDPHF